MYAVRIRVRILLEKNAVVGTLALVAVTCVSCNMYSHPPTIWPPHLWCAFQLDDSLVLYHDDQLARISAVSAAGLGMCISRRVC